MLSEDAKIATEISFTLFHSPLLKFNYLEVNHSPC